MAEPCLHLLIQYCTHRLPARQAEYDQCVRQNLANPWVKAVHNFAEHSTRVPAEFSSHPKHRRQPIDHWLTYRDAIQFAAEQLPGETVGLINLDIFLDPQSNWSSAAAFAAAGVVLCLTRTEFAPGEEPYIDPGLLPTGGAVSQDAWFFKSPIDVPDCDFELGTLGCDNAIAERFLRSGRQPLNAPGRFRILHFDRARGKSFANTAAIYAAERPGERRRRPERQGQYLVPDIDRLPILDPPADNSNLSDLDRYRLACDLFTQRVRVSNP